MFIAAVVTTRDASSLYKFCTDVEPGTNQTHTPIFTVIFHAYLRQETLQPEVYPDCSATHSRQRQGFQVHGSVMECKSSQDSMMQVSSEISANVNFEAVLCCTTVVATIVRT